MVAAFRSYLDTIPTSKRFDRELFYELRDVVGKSGFGIGSAGLPAYNILVEGYSQALDNDVVLSMKQANVPAVSPLRRHRRGRRLLQARGAPHRGEPAGAPGAHRPAARLHRHRRHRVRRQRGVAVRGRPRLDRHQRARGHARGRRPARPGDRQDPLRLRRGQRPGPGGHPGRGRPSSPRSRAAAASSATGCASGASTTRCGSARTTRCSSTPSARDGWGWPRPEATPGPGLRRRCATCRRTARRPRRRAGRPRRGPRGRRR